MPSIHDNPTAPGPDRLLKNHPGSAPSTGNAVPCECSPVSPEKGGDHPRRKKLLIIGAGGFQLPLVQKASETCDVLLAAPVITEDFDPYITDRLIVDVRDKEKILGFAEKNRIDGVITDQTDIAVRSVAYVAEKMGLPGIGYETGVLFTDKSLMRRRLTELGLPVLENRTVDTVDEACAFFRELCEKKTSGRRSVKSSPKLPAGPAAARSSSNSLPQDGNSSSNLSFSTTNITLSASATPSISIFLMPLRQKAASSRRQRMKACGPKCWPSMKRSSAASASARASRTANTLWREMRSI